MLSLSTMTVLDTSLVLGFRVKAAGVSTKSLLMRLLEHVGGVVLVLVVLGMVNASIWTLAV